MLLPFFLSLSVIAISFTFILSFKVKYRSSIILNPEENNLLLHLIIKLLLIRKKPDNGSDNFVFVTRLINLIRVLKGAVRKRPMSIDTFVRVFANYFLTYLSNLMNNQKLSDAHTCYKVFRSDILNNIILKENGFNFCPEFTAKISKLGIKILEVPIDYNGRTHDEGKKISLIDGFRAVYAIIKYNFFDLN